MSPELWGALPGLGGPVLLGLGLIAGGLTTVAGMGGGLLMLALVSLLFGPMEALVWTAPGLLFGNAHRLWMFRRQAPWRLLLPVMAGVVPVALLGAWLAGRVPTPFLGALLLVAVGLSLAKSAGWMKWEPPANLGVWVGALGGVFGAVGSGAGAIVGPFFVARGLTGTPYVAALAALGVTLHATRWAGYALSGSVQGLGPGLLLAAGVLLGNLAGRALSTRLHGRSMSRLQLVALCGSGLLAAGRMLLG
ncbi:MAG: putative membrane protein YfcA [Cognaticolwellia sp.]|jgi:uncharacterized membrane protein YfcA